MCEKLPKSLSTKQAVIQTIVKKSGIIHSEKQPGNNDISNETTTALKIKILLALVG